MQYYPKNKSPFDGESPLGKDGRTSVDASFHLRFIHSP